jgi:hypothetical protein
MKTLCIVTIFIFFFCSIDAALAEGLQSNEWADLPANMQPRVPEPHLFVPEVPTLEPPLISDLSRRAILYDRIGPQAYVFQIPLDTVVDLVYQQAEIERHMEACLPDPQSRVNCPTKQQQERERVPKQAKKPSSDAIYEDS